MSGLMDKAKDFAQKKADNFGTPGDSTESKADDKINNPLNQAANDAGVPQQFDQGLDKVADNKVNGDIPGGN